MKKTTILLTILSVTTLFAELDKSVASVSFAAADDEKLVGMIFNGRDYHQDVKGVPHFMEELEALPPLSRAPEAAEN